SGLKRVSLECVGWPVPGRASGCRTGQTGKCAKTRARALGTRRALLAGMRFGEPSMWCDVRCERCPLESKCEIGRAAIDLFVGDEKGCPHCKRLKEEGLELDVDQAALDSELDVDDETAPFERYSIALLDVINSARRGRSIPKRIRDELSDLALLIGARSIPID